MNPWGVAPPTTVRHDLLHAWTAAVDKARDQYGADRAVANQICQHPYCLKKTSGVNKRNCWTHLHGKRLGA